VFGATMLVGAAPAIAAAAPAGANAGCPTSASTAALEEYGDSSAYTLLTGASFESGAPGWTLSNAAVTSDTGVGGGLHSLVIQPNGSAISPSLCVSTEYPSFRLFVRQVAGASKQSPLNQSSLTVSLRWTILGMLPVTTTVATLKPDTTWTLTPVLALAKALPLLTSTQTLTVSVGFQSNDGTYAIDDVYIDPYRR
jgi:hypothetical protein